MNLLPLSRSQNSPRLLCLQIVASTAAFFFCLGLNAVHAAETKEVVIARGFAIPHLPLMVMEHEKLLEKHLAAAGLPETKVTYTAISSGNTINDSLISGALAFGAGGAPPLLTLWDRTRGSIGALGVCAEATMPLYLNTRNPAIKTVADFTETDKIAVGAVKVSLQAILLQMAAMKAFGPAGVNRLDPFTVALSAPDASVALLSGAGEVNSNFSLPPFQYTEVKKPGIHTVTTSNEIMGGPHTFSMVYSTNKFREANSKTFGAFLSAMREAMTRIHDDKPGVAKMYLELTHSKETEEAILAILNDPLVEFTMTPRSIMKFVSFMNEIGTLKNKPASWQEIFAPEIADLPGS